MCLSHYVVAHTGDASFRLLTSSDLASHWSCKKFIVERVVANIALSNLLRLADLQNSRVISIKLSKSVPVARVDRPVHQFIVSSSVRVINFRDLVVPEGLFTENTHARVIKGRVLASASVPSWSSNLKAFIL